MTPEEQRALDWQTSRRRRREFKRSLQTQLKAPGANKVDLEKRWEPCENKQYAIETYDEWELEDVEYGQSHSIVASYLVRRDSNRTRY